VRVLFLTRGFDRLRSEVRLLDALESDPTFHVVSCDPPDLGGVGLLARIETFDAVVVFMKYADLVAAPAIEWHGYEGLRVMLEHDAWFNYAAVAPALTGTFPGTFSRHGFDLLVSSGREVTRLLNDAGTRAAWVPKGYDERVFYDLGGARAGLCTFGSGYPARQALVRNLARGPIPISQVAAPYSGLGVELNKYLGCIVCNMDGTYPRGLPGKIIRRLAPGVAVRVRPGLEPMLKNFEAAAAGCAVFADAIPELEALGFVDGKTVVLYRSFEELVERATVLLDQPEALRAIGAEASKLCAERHTWSHRVPQLAAVIEATLRS